MEKLKQNPIVKKLGLNRIMLVCILVLMFVVFKVVLGSKFPVGDSIKSTLNYVYFLGFFRGCGPTGGRAPCGSAVPVHAP